MRLAAQAKGGFYPTPYKVVDMIPTLMRPPYGYHNTSRETNPASSTIRMAWLFGFPVFPTVETWPGCPE